MTVAADLSLLPGKSGQEESIASQQGGGFAWSRQRAAEFGPVCRTTLNGLDAVLLTGEIGLKAFYDTRYVVRHGTKTPKSLAFLHDGVTEVVPILDGEAHLARKGALLHVTAPEALQRYLPVLDAVIARALQRWAGVEQIDLKAELQRMAFEALSTVITGAPGSDAAFATYGEATLGFLGVDYDKGIAARDKLLEWYRAALAENRQKAPSEARSNMIGILAHTTALTDAQIVSEVQHIFIGSGGVWVGSCNMLALLAGHPAAMQRAREEARKLDAPPSFSQLDEATFLQNLVEEVIRWSPIINFQIGRVAKAFEVGGHTLPEGALVLAGFYATNHDPSIYPAPDAFNPERVEQKAEQTKGCPFSKSTPFTYVPFGGGDRVTGHRCLGEPLVYLTLKLLLAKAAREYSWTLVHPEEVGSAPAPYMASRVLLRLTRAD